MSYQVKHKPFIYYGGKSRLLDNIIPLIPSHDVYCEPFAGGASVFWAKTLAEHNILNDKNILIYTFYKVGKKRPDELVNELRNMLYHAHEKALAWEVCQDPEAHDELTVAAAMFVCIMQGFGGKIDSAFGRSYDKDSVGRRFYAAVECLPGLLKKLEYCQIDKLDACDLIDRVNKKSKNAFIFADPPYYNATMGHYGGYTEGDFLNLINILKNSPHRFMLTCYDNEHIHKHGWNVDMIKSSNNINDKEGNDNRKKTEAIVANYKLYSQCSLF